MSRPSKEITSASVAEISASEIGGVALMLSSKARYGMMDFGVNRRRVKRWLTALEARLAG